MVLGRTFLVRKPNAINHFEPQIRCLSALQKLSLQRESFRFRRQSIGLPTGLFLPPTASFLSSERIFKLQKPINLSGPHFQRDYSSKSSDFSENQRLNNFPTVTRFLLEQRRQHSKEADDEETKPKEKRKFTRRRIQVPNYGPDADEAVRSLQSARQEQARAKTAANVRRALYGNGVICAAKLGAWLSSGSSAMMSEFVHSVVDCGNQSLLLMGLRDSRNVADRRHPYGYGKSVYFWALVSALGTFFLGAGVSMSHAIGELWDPSLSEITNEVWAVLTFSFVVDGFVLYKTMADVRETKPKHISLWKHLSSLRDPATMAVILEDSAACIGIVFAIAGIGASHYMAMPIFDGIAGVGISALLGGIGLALVRVNHSFLLGQGVSKEMTDDMEKIIRSRRSIDNVSRIQSQWTGPETFSFKAEVDFDGTYLAAQLMPRYQGEFKKAREDLDQELEVLLCWYAEDVMRAVEREVRHIEAMIRQKYPGAEYIELEPMSTNADQFAIDDSFEEKLLLVEKEEMQRLIRVLYESKSAPNKAEGAVDFPVMPSDEITYDVSDASNDKKTEK